MKIEFKNFDRILKIRQATMSAVILAAGSSVRFGGDKISASVDGMTVLGRSLAAFDACPAVREIILVLPKNGFEKLRAALSSTIPEKVTHIVRGGNTRQESAICGIEACNPKAKYLAIHDAARCLVTPDMIESVFRAACEHRAASAACHVVDTVKFADEKGFIDHTIDRDKVWLVSTPQIFYANLYRAAAYTAREDDFEATDDCMLAERIGFKVRLVDVGPDNIKVTYPEDIERAEAILRRRGSRS